jgi:plasmid stabilization system protein ParE
MVTKVILSQFARDQLSEIFDYHVAVAGRSVARRIVGNILSSLDILGSNPRAGQVEELLEKYAEGYRRLVEGNYKIIYWIADESVVVVESIFDCRQNPVKIGEFK